MPCYAPLQGWRSRNKTENGKRSIVFKLSEGFGDMPVEVPCGQCIGCKISRARQWALRCVHEASLHEFNAFVTLTYNNEHLPAGGVLVKRDLQLFLKRLRKVFDENYSARFRYFAVGEYGDSFGRPHFHLLLFGVDFPDKKYWKGFGLSRQFRSKLLEDAWSVNGKLIGHCTTGTVTSASAQYVSHYLVKMVTGARAASHYGSKPKEFALMSRRPGIGAGWIDKFKDSVLPRDFVVYKQGNRAAIPRYYIERQPQLVQLKYKDRRLRRFNDDPRLKEEARGSRRYARSEVAKANFDARMRERSMRKYEDANLRSI